MIACMVWPTLCFVHCRCCLWPFVSEFVFLHDYTINIYQVLNEWTFLSALHPTFIYIKVSRMPALLIDIDTAARNWKSGIPDASHTTSYELSGSFIFIEEASVHRWWYHWGGSQHPILHSRRLNSNEMCSHSLLKCSLGWTNLIAQSTHAALCLHWWL